MKKGMCIIMTVILLFSIISFISFAVSSERLHIVGGVVLPTEEKKTQYYRQVNSETRTLPSAVDSTNLFPLPGDQGNRPSCVPWAVSYAVAGTQAYARGWTPHTDKHYFSPSFIYNRYNWFGASEDITDIGFGVTMYGVCTIPYMAYTPNDYQTQPNAVQYANAELYCNDFYIVRGINAIKSCIAQHLGVVILIPVYSDFDSLDSNNEIYDTLEIGMPRGYHAICLIGYDDSKSAFKFINSWGTDWGLGGYGWISYNILSSSEDGYVFESMDDEYLLGDVNGDGQITTVDSNIVLNYCASSITLTASQLVLADVNGDGRVTTSDSTSIAKYVSGIITKMPLYN